MDISTLSDADRVRLMEQAFSAVEEVCSQLREDEWDLRTDCPAWTVKDNLSHMAAFEAVMTGTLPKADADVSHLPHIGDEFEAKNEREVEGRRHLHGKEVLDEFLDATAKRLKDLASFDEAAWQREVPTPVGKMQQRTALGIRILDIFYHEQDIRRATGRAGHLDGDVSRFVFEWMATRGLPRVSAKNVPDGTVIVFEVRAPGRTVTIAVKDGKGALADEPSNPSAKLSMDLETFFMLLGGRRTHDELRAAERLKVEGDPEIAQQILDHIVVVP